MKHTIIPTLLIVILFSVAQLLGLRVVQYYQENALPHFLGTAIERPTLTTEGTLLFILTGILLGTIIMFIIMQTGLTTLWKIWYALATVLCLHITFSIIIQPALATVLALILTIWKMKKPNILIHNATELFMYGGLAAIFAPLLTIKSGIILYTLIALYDAYAVWKSKHMIALANFQTKTGTFAGLLLPYKHTGIKKHKHSRIALLGGGDIMFPLLFASTVQQTYGLPNALITTIGTILALSILLSASKKEQYYPAIPFLLIGSLIGFVISLQI